MPPYFDLYVLARERSAAVANHFLDAFVPDRDQSAADYGFPKYASQLEVVLKSAAEAIQYCESHPVETQSIYFRNLGTDPAHAMLFFTSDGGLILGLSVLGRQDEWFGRLKEYARSEVGYITFESPPAATVAEFRQLAARAYDTDAT